MTCKKARSSWTIVRPLSVRLLLLSIKQSWENEFSRRQNQTKILHTSQKDFFGVLYSPTKNKLKKQLFKKISMANQIANQPLAEVGLVMALSSFLAMARIFQAHTILMERRKCPQAQDGM